MEKLKSLFSKMNEKPIAFHSIYAKITGSVTAGLLLSQIIYWDKIQKKRNDSGLFYKTDKDWCEELSMGLYELKGAKKKLKDFGIIKINRKGIPAKTFYTLDFDKLITLITSCGKNQQLEGGKTNNYSEEKPTTIIEDTETTPETTSETISNPEFEKFWDTYKKKVGVDNCLKKWKKLTIKDKTKIFEVLDDYVKSKPDKKYRKNPLSWLNGKCWNDEIIYFNKDDDDSNSEPKSFEENLPYL